jgi:hypothetical protein
VANRLPAFDSALVRWSTIVHGTRAFPTVGWPPSLRADPAYGGLDPPLQYWQPRFSPEMHLTHPHRCRPGDRDGDK